MPTTWWGFTLLGVATAGRVRQGSSGVPVQGLHGGIQFEPDEDQQRLVDFLVEAGFKKYATKEFFLDIQQQQKKCRSDV